MEMQLSRGRDLVLSYRLSDRQKSLFERLLHPAEEDQRVDPKQVSKIRCYLECLINPAMEPKHMVGYPITDVIVDKWVDFLLKTRLSVWLREFAIYRNILEVLTLIGIDVRETEGKRTRTSRLREVIRLKKLSMESGRPIPLSSFMRSQNMEDKPLYNPEDWIRMQSDPDQATQNQGSTLLDTLEDSNVEEVNDEATAALFEKVVASDEEWDHRTALPDFSEASGRATGNERGAWNMRAVEDAYKKEDEEVAQNKATFRMRPIFEAVPSLYPHAALVLEQEAPKGDGDIPGNPYWVLRLNFEGESKATIKGRVKRVHWASV